jgi:hypothetical protein
MAPESEEFRISAVAIADRINFVLDRMDRGVGLGGFPDDDIFGGGN